MNRKYDRRTQAGQEESVLVEIRNHGGFSIFWSTDNARRAAAVERLKASGKIVREGGEQFPWMRFSIAENN